MLEEKKLVIMVDDNPVSLQSGINVFLENYSVATIPSAVKLFEFLKTKIPDIILLDIDMPDVDGYQIMRALKLRPDTKNIPVIFLTAMTDEVNEKKGLSMGAVDYIKKPFQPSDLVKRVEAHLF